MLLDIVLFSIGLALLYYGAEYMVHGSANVAMIMGVSPLMVGLTVVAFGTSAPELVACLVAVYQGSNDIALGNVIGSNIANVGLVLGSTALVAPIVIKTRGIRKELMFMILFTALFIVLGVDGGISRTDGIILFMALMVFTFYCVIAAKRHKEAPVDEETVEMTVEELADKKHGLGYEIAITAGGIVGIVIGAYLLIDSAASIARQLGISELIIGVTIVAIGTSLPELAASLVAAKKGHAAMAFGNIVGSNIYNIGLILGLTAAAAPLSVDWESAADDIGVMAIYAALLYLFMARGKMGRPAGGFLITGYIGYIAWTALM